MLWWVCGGNTTSIPHKVTPQAHAHIYYLTHTHKHTLFWIIIHSEPISFTVHKDSNMCPNLTVIFQSFIRREERGKVPRGSNWGKQIPPRFCLHSLFLSLSLSLTDCLWLPLSHPPNPLPPLCITASFPTVMSAPGAGREQGRGEVLRGIRVFKIYTTVFL